MATLIINTWSSKCGDCGRSADPNEKSHESVLGHEPDKGCGAVFTETSSEYIGMHIKEAAAEMRPDLPWAGPPD